MMKTSMGAGLGYDEGSTWIIWAHILRAIGVEAPMKKELDAEKVAVPKEEGCSSWYCYELACQVGLYTANGQSEDHRIRSY